MYKRRKISKLGRKTSHRNLMIRGQLQSIIKYGHVTTTSSRAKVLVQSIESIITTILSTEGFERLRRLSPLKVDKIVMNKFFDYVLSSRPKISIIKVGVRSGDNSEMSLVKVEGWNEETKKKSLVSNNEVKKENKDVKKTILPPKNTKSTRKTAKVFTGSKERSRSRSGL